MSGAGTLIDSDLVTGILASPLGSILSTASWRGVTFFMPSSQDMAGRRIAQIFFPGIDVWRVQDFGKLDGQIRVFGLIVGDDYVIRAQRMREALMKPGAATLIHPWWGSLRCRLLQPGTISFSDQEIRLARFEAVFIREPVQTSSSGLFSEVTDTLTRLFTTADSVVDQATLMMQSVLSPLAVPVVMASAVSSVVSSVGGIWSSLTGSAPVATQTATSDALAFLNAGVALPTSNTDGAWANSLVTALSAVPAALVAAVTPVAQSAVAPAQLVTGDTTDDVDPSAATTMLLSAADQSGSLATQYLPSSLSPESTLATALAARTLTVVQAIAAQSSVTWSSQVDAEAGRDRMLAAIDAISSDIDVITSEGLSVPVAGLASSVGDMRSALVADINARIGRLPALLTLQTHRQMSAWQIAYAIAGDNVSDVESTWDDLISRNGIRHPGRVGPGDIDVLEPVA